MKDNKGFTLIELLAVITIMGILMMVAIPTISRTIENTRKDTFIDTVKTYCQAAKTMWVADNLYCTAADGNRYVSSAVPTGHYFILVDSSETRSGRVDLLEQGGKSSWGQRDIVGLIKVHVKETTNTETSNREINIYPYLSDAVHGVNIYYNETDGIYYARSTATSVKYEDLVRGDLVMTNIPRAGEGYLTAYSTMCVER